MASANPKTHDSPEDERARSDSHVIIVSEQSYDDMMQASEREEVPNEELVNAYLLYRQRVTRSAR